MKEKSLNLDALNSSKKKKKEKNKMIKKWLWLYDKHAKSMAGGCTYHSV